MSEPPNPADLELVKLNMLEARKALDDYEQVHGFGRTAARQALEREFSKATEAYLKISGEVKFEG